MGMRQEASRWEQPVIMLGGTDCDPTKETEFNDWYDNIHMPLALEAPGMLWGARYERILRRKMSDDTEYPKYLAVYGIQNEASLKEMLDSARQRSALWRMPGCARQQWD